MAKKFSCDLCGGEFGFYDCANLGINGQVFTLCWGCQAEVFEKLRAIGRPIIGLVESGLENRFPGYEFKKSAR